MKALMPTETVRSVTTANLCTGMIEPTAYTGSAIGAPLTGRYGLKEFRFLDGPDLVALAIAYNNDVTNTMLQALRQGSTSFQRMYCSTSCVSRVSNVTGTTITVDFFRIKTKRQLAPNTGWPTQNAAGMGTAQYEGSPLVLAQNLMFNQGPATVGGVSANAPYVADLDVDFWKVPLWSSFYKIVGHSTVSLHHGQSAEFKWKLPKVTWSTLELSEWGNLGVSGGYMPGKTFFTVWRIRGALGALAASGNTGATTAIATAVVATTRTYKIRGAPIHGNIQRKVIDLASDTGDGTWQASGTQVYVNNEFGTGATVQPAQVS